MNPPPPDSRAALCLVPTPIGNLRDITLRAIDAIKEADIILAEDTRKTGFLLKHLGIEKKMQSYHNFNEHRQAQSLVRRMQAGERMALLSDAGTPSISDPGFLLVRACLEHGLAVTCLPGATAFVPALAQSGFPTNRFVFEGFLPHKKGRQKAWKELAEEKRAIVLYESPRRLVKTLEQINEFLGADRIVSVSRELTKLHEETITNNVASVLARFKAQEPRGEIVIVIKGKDNNDDKPTTDRETDDTSG